MITTAPLFANTGTFIGGITKTVILQQLFSRATKGLPHKRTWCHLIFAGLELAVSARDVGREKEDYYILLVTAGFAIWNMGAGFLAGVLMQESLKRKIFKI